MNVNDVPFTLVDSPDPTKQILKQKTEINGKSYIVTVIMSQEKFKNLSKEELSSEIMKAVAKMELLAIAYNLGSGKTSKLTLQGDQLIRERPKQDAKLYFLKKDLPEKLKSLEKKITALANKISEDEKKGAVNVEDQAFLKHLDERHQALEKFVKENKLDVSPPSPSVTIEKATPKGVHKKAEVDHTEAPDHTKLSSDTKLVVGTQISNNVQENKGAHLAKGYDWRKAYSEKPEMKPFLGDEVNSAVIAHSGRLSNFQRVPFKDPLSEDSLSPEMKTAEHMFQAYKFRAGSDERKAILNQEGPGGALRKASELVKATGKGRPEAEVAKSKELWDAAKEELMVFVQLSKALEGKTGLQEELHNTGNAFIIEDTSSRNISEEQKKDSKFKDKVRLGAEKQWGDNGNGQGANKLGLAQMKARQYINEQGLTKETVLKYYNDNVKEKLNNYYDSLPKFE